MLDFRSYGLGVVCSLLLPRVAAPKDGRDKSSLQNGGLQRIERGDGAQGRGEERKREKERTGGE